MDFKRLGVFGDWDRPIDQWILKRKQTSSAHSEGSLPTDMCTRATNRCTGALDCGSALAEAEVEYKDKGVLHHRCPLFGDRCRIVDGALPCHSRWTRRRSFVFGYLDNDTLDTSANQAVALNPGLEYVIVQADAPRKGRLMVAEDCLKGDGPLEYEHYHVIAYGRGDAFEGLKQSTASIIERCR